MTSADPQLTPAEEAEILAIRKAEITPLVRPLRAPGQRPVVVLIAGQPGASKSTNQRLVHEALGADSTASYDFDDDPAAHPRYDAIMRANGVKGNDIVDKSMPPELRGRLLDHLRFDPQYDVVTSAPMQSEDAAKAWIDGFRDAGYRVTVVYVATNEADSLLAVANRYQTAKDDTGVGRMVKEEHHNHAYRGVPDAAHALESQAYVDDIYVVDRDGNVLWENHRVADGRMEKPPGARDAIIAERNRPPTPAEHRRFVEIALPLRQRGDELEQPVDDMVRAAMRKQIERPAAQPRAHEPPPERRIDAQLSDLQRLAGSGVAPPQIIGPPGSTPSRPSIVRGSSGGRSREDGPRDR